MNTYRQYKAPESDLPRHGSVWAHTDVGEEGDQDSGDGDASTGPVLAHCACGEVDVDVCAVQLFLQAVAKHLNKHKHLAGRIHFVNQY